MHTLLILFVLWWVNPIAEGDACTAAGSLSDLGHVEVWGAVIPGTEVLLASIMAVGREGLREEVEVPLTGLIEGRVVAFDTTGNAACAVPWQVDKATLSVPALKPGRPQWYDVAGRRIERPVRSGLYFYDPGDGRPRRVIVLK